MADLVWPEQAAGTEEVIVLQVSSIAISKATRFAMGWSSGHFPHLMGVVVKHPWWVPV